LLQALLIGCLLNTVITSAAVASERPVLDMLVKMQSALQHLNYHGTLVYSQNGQIQSMRVVHKADADGEIERLISLNGSAREVVRKNDVVTCYMPDSKSVLVGERQFKGNVLAQLAENDFEQLQGFYHFQLEATDRVAGLPAQAILIKPKDSYRYGYRLWLDRDNGLLLKSDMLDEEGKVLEQAMFADVAIVDAIPLAMLEPAAATEGYRKFEHDAPDESAGIVDSPWHITALPEGFTVKARFRHHMPASDSLAEHWVISDGLASISVYIENLAKDQTAFEGASSAGAFNAYGAVADHHQVTVVGEVPAMAVEKVANSVSFNPAPAGGGSDD
jgi:sigma-E factor negative regulatory protein RseB